MKLFRVGFIFFKKERILTYMKPKRKQESLRKERKEIQEEMDLGVVGNEELFSWGAALA